MNSRLPTLAGPLRFFGRRLLPGLLFLSLASCIAAEAARDAKQTYNQADDLSSRGTNLAEIINAKVTNRPIFGAMVTRNQHGLPFPASWESPGVTFRTGPDLRDALPLQTFAAELGAQLGIPVTLDLAAPQSMEATAVGGATAATPTAGATPAPAASAGTNAAINSLIASTNPPGTVAGDPVITNTLTRTLAEIGPTNTHPLMCRITPPRAVMPLSRLLTYVDSLCGVRSTYDGQRVIVRRYIEELLTIAAFNGKNTYKNGLTSSSSSSATGAGSTSSSSSTNGGGSATSVGSQNGDSTWSTDVYAEVVAGIKARVPSDAVVTPNPAAHGVTVVAPPDALDRARSYVDLFNRTSSRQISLLVEVLQASLTDADTYGMDLTMATNRKWGSITGAPSGIGSTAAALAAMVPAGAHGWLAQNLAGSSITARALTTSGQARTVSSKSFVILNGSTFMLDESKLDDYISGQSSISSTSAGVTTPGGFTTSTTFSGTQLMVEPLLLPDGVIRLKYQPIIQGKPDFISAGTTSDVSIQLRRNQDVRSFIQEVSVQNGGTVIAYATRASDSATDNAGLGSATLPLLGGHINGNTDHNVFVILLTPRELDPMGRAPTPAFDQPTASPTVN